MLKFLRFGFSIRMVGIWVLNFKFCNSIIEVRPFCLKIDAWNSSCIVDFQSLFFDEMSSLMFGFEIRLSKVALWNFMCLVCFFETVCSEDWMTMGETEGADHNWLKESEMNLSCQEPLTCLFVGYSHIHLFCVRDSELGVIFRNGRLGWTSSRTSKLRKEEGYVWLWSTLKANKRLFRVRSAPPIRTPFCGTGRKCRITHCCSPDLLQHQVAQMPGGGGPKGRLPRAVSCGEIFVKPFFLLSDKSH